MAPATSLPRRDTSTGKLRDLQVLVRYLLMLADHEPASHRGETRLSFARELQLEHYRQPRVDENTFRASVHLASRGDTQWPRSALGVRSDITSWLGRRREEARATPC